MKLTDNTKEDFKKWMLDKSIKDYHEEYVEMVVNQFDGFIYGKLHAFECLSPSMQWGVIQDFADSVTDKDSSGMLPKVTRGYACFFTELSGNMQKYDTRQEARSAAVEKFNQLYNNK